MGSAQSTWTHIDGMSLFPLLFPSLAPYTLRSERGQLVNEPSKKAFTVYIYIISAVYIISHLKKHVYVRCFLFFFAYPP